MELNELRNKVKENIPLLKEKLLNDLISGNTNWKKDKSKFEYLGVNFSSNFHQVIVIEIDKIDTSEWSENDKQLWKKEDFRIEDVCRHVYVNYSYLETHARRVREYSTPCKKY